MVSGSCNPPYFFQPIHTFFLSVTLITIFNQKVPLKSQKVPCMMMHHKMVVCVLPPSPQVSGSQSPRSFFLHLPFKAILTLTDIYCWLAHQLCPHSLPHSMHATFYLKNKQIVIINSGVGNI